MREQPGFFVSCPAFGVVTLKSSPLPQSCPGFLEPPPEVLSGVPLLPMFCPDLLGLSSPSPTPVPPRPLDSSPTPSVPSHRPPQPRFPPRPSGTSPAAGPFREAPLGNGAAPRPGRTFRKPREACRETPVRPAAERTGPGARPASPRPPAAPRATPAVRALEVVSAEGHKARGGELGRAGGRRKVPESLGGKQGGGGDGGRGQRGWGKVPESLGGNRECGGGGRWGMGTEGCRGSVQRIGQDRGWGTGKVPESLGGKQGGGGDGGRGQRGWGKVPESLGGTRACGGGGRWGWGPWGSGAGAGDGGRFQKVWAGLRAVRAALKAQTRPQVSVCGSRGSALLPCRRGHRSR
ncbi:lymphocyte antigen 6K isoform X1 [Camelus ferus]|uniref:Lymphocyte antigen 6K isoform X1 n=1 Tax=Camelus ferus TaxID=419612 RepID=A0A8B8S0C0_CAMFR|nr:lymphocyte antigen 6K isoform X1 [Camelus ferus]